MPNPPKIDPARGTRGRGPLKLPAGGRLGPVPEWPLSRPTATEKAAWEQLWRTPQSVAWERLGWTRTVARYCRVMVESEKPGAQPTRMAQATALEDRLGLTPKSMRLLLWEVSADEVSAKRASSKGARARVKAVG